MGFTGSWPLSPPLRPTAETLGRQAYDELRHWLVSGALAPGEKLSLRTVAARLGVSMQPVRDAVTRLVADRALEVLPNRAVHVPVLDVAQFRELTTIRLVIEGFAAERAALMRTAAQLKPMRRYEGAFRRQGERRTPNLATAIAHNQVLHFAVYRAAGLPSLLPLIEGLWLRIGPVLNIDLHTDRLHERMAKSIRCHAEMVAAIERGDAGGARAALAADIEGAALHIESRLHDTSESSGALKHGSRIA